MRNFREVAITALDWTRQRDLIATLVVCVSLTGCAEHSVNRVPVDPREPRSERTLRVIREFFEQNPPDEVEVSARFQDAGAASLHWEEQRPWIDALRQDTRLLDTGDSEVILLCARGLIQFDGPYTSLLVGLSDLGFSLGSTYRYLFTNAPLARLALQAYDSTGPRPGYQDRLLRHSLKVAAGEAETGNLPERTSEDRQIEARRARQQSYCYEMTSEEMAALDQVQASVEDGGDVDALIEEDPEDEGGERCTRLHRAVRAGYREVALYMLIHNADPNIPSSSGWYPLMVACQKADLSLVALLVLAGARVDVRSRYGGPLYYAADTWGNRDDTPARVEIIEILVSRDANVNARVESDGDTPLHAAVGHDSPNIMEALLVAGADTEARNGLGVTPLQQAIRSFRFQNARLLLEKGAKPDFYVTEVPLRAEWVGQFLDKYPEVVNISGPGGNRPLHYVAMKGQKDIVRLLLKRGANVAAKNKQGETALDLARKKGREDVVALLEAHIAKRKERSPKP
jgi:ankyrin repeat protein